MNKIKVLWPAFLALATAQIGVVQCAAQEDTTAPTLAITYPTRGRYVNRFASRGIFGRAVDNDDQDRGSGIARVDLYLFRKSDNRYWSGIAWVAERVALSVTFANQGYWSRRQGLPGFDDSTPGLYTITAEAFDKAGNRASDAESATVEKIPPVVSVSVPKNGATVYGVLRLVRGSSADNTGFAGVRLFIKRSSDGRYWHGRGWGPTVVSLSVAHSDYVGASSWYRNFAIPVGRDTYFLTAVAEDDAGNKSSATATIKTEPSPYSILNALNFASPRNGAVLSALPTISIVPGYQYENIPYSRVVLFINRCSDNHYWNGEEWVVGPRELTMMFNGTRWKLSENLPRGADLRDSQYILTVVGFIPADNPSAPAAKNSASITVTIRNSSQPAA